MTFILIAVAACLAAGALLAVGLAMPLTPIPAFGRSMPAYIIADTAVVDVDGGRVRTGMTVAVSQGRIVAVAAGAPDAKFGGWPVIDGRGRYLMPGLWDSHLHTVELSPRLHFPLLIANGVTTVRNMGDGCSWRSAPDCLPDDVIWARDGAMVPAITPTIAATTGHHVEDLTRIDDVPPLMRALKLRGETFVKIQLADDVSPAVVAELFAAANDAGLGVAGHFPAGTNLADGRFAMLSLEHDHQLRPQCQKHRDGCVALLAKLAQRGTAYVPTHVASSAQDARLGSQPKAEAAALSYATAPVALVWRLIRAANDDQARARNAGDLAVSLQLTRAAQRAGVRVLAGSDALDPFVLHGDALHDELVLLGQAGVSNADVLRAATIAPADVFGFGRRKGRIAPGYDADMIILTANPLEDIGATRRIDSVTKGDRVFAASDLASMRRFARAQAGDFAVNARAWWALLAG